MANVVYEGENLSLPEGTTFKKSSLYMRGNKTHIWIYRGKYRCDKKIKLDKRYYKKINADEYLVLDYSSTASGVLEREKIVSRIVNANGFKKDCY